MGKKQMETTVTTTKNEVATVSANFGVGNLDIRDLVIPKILLTQKMSDAAEEGLAKEGEFIDSIDHHNFGTSFDAQVFYINKSWRVYEDAEKEKYLRTEPVTPENVDADYTYRDLVYQLSVLVGDDVGSRGCYGISLQRTNLQVGRKLATLFQKRGGTAGVILTFSGRKEKNDKGSWVKWDFTVKRDSTQEEIAEAFGWYQSMSAGRIKHHEKEEEESTPTVVKEDDLPF